jgi:hypothetical protein
LTRCAFAALENTRLYELAIMLEQLATAGCGSLMMVVSPRLHLHGLEPEQYAAADAQYSLGLPKSTNGAVGDNPTTLT